MPSVGRNLNNDIVGQTVYRLIPSRFPTITLFEDLLDPAELELAYKLEALTNDRLRDLAGDIAYVPPGERMVGPGSSVVMAAFTHVGAKSRFSDGSYGVFYAGLTLETSIEECKAGQARFLSATSEPPFEVTLRAYATRVALPLLDIREPKYEEYHLPDDWLTAQQFGAKARASGENGLWYRSVRHPRGECIAAFKPFAVTPVTQAGHYRFVWDGHAITHVFELKSVD